MKRTRPVPPDTPRRDYLEKPLPDWIQGSTAERFSAIYRHWFWGEPESVSGPGSSIEQTKQIRKELPGLLAELQVASLLDIPCGDFHWMRLVRLGDVNYLGADIVEDLVNENRTRYSGRRRTFTKLDLTCDALPKVDLILVRDCLVHLSFHDIRSALRNIRKSGSRYLLTTTFPQHHPNRDIETGDWRPLDLQADPFFLPAPLRLIREECPEQDYPDKSLGLWLTCALPQL